MDTMALQSLIGNIQRANLEERYIIATMLAQLDDFTKLSTTPNASSIRIEMQHILCYQQHRSVRIHSRRAYSGLRLIFLTVDKQEIQRKRTKT